MFAGGKRRRSDLSRPSPSIDGSADDGDSDQSGTSKDSGISRMSFKSDRSKELIITFKAGRSPLESDFSSPSTTNDESADDSDSDQSSTSIKSIVFSKSDKPERPVTVLSGGDSPLKVSTECVSVQSCGSPGYISAGSDLSFLFYIKDGSTDDGDSNQSSASKDSGISSMSFKSDNPKELIIDFKAGRSPLESDLSPPSPTNDGSADDGDSDQVSLKRKFSECVSAQSSGSSVQGKT